MLRTNAVDVTNVEFKWRFEFTILLINIFLFKDEWIKLKDANKNYSRVDLTIRCWKTPLMISYGMEILSRKYPIALEVQKTIFLEVVRTKRKSSPVFIFLS